MKERPILFSGPMVRAILDGSKTQTRRVVRAPKGLEFTTPGELQAVAYDAEFDTEAGEAWFLTAGDQGWDGPVRCPYGCPGDRLWVRETWASVPATAYRQSEGVDQTVNPDEPYYAAIYRAGFDRANGGFRWRPSIHMPRWASRLTLEVVSVRVERLQSITEADAGAEGCEVTTVPGCGVDDWWCHDTCQRHGSCQYGRTRRIQFRELWDSINGTKPGRAWADNCWVWRIEFKRVES